jgi:hypothetical protein
MSTLKLKCAVMPDDELVTYPTKEVGPTPFFAIVCENVSEHNKISVMLIKGDARLLRDQLNQFLKEWP